MDAKQKLIWFLLLSHSERWFHRSCQTWVCVSVCVFVADMSLVNHCNWWSWAVTWVWDSCDLVRSHWRDKSVFAACLRWNWRVLWSESLVVSIHGPFVLLTSVGLSWTSQSASQSVSCVASSFLSPSYPPLLPVLFLPVCACSSRRARRCCASSRGSSCATTACRRGAGGQPRRCGRDLCPWRSIGREPPPSASATASCAAAPDSQSPSPTDWPRRRPWWRGDAAIFAFVPSAGAFRDWGCVRRRPRVLSRLPHTVTRA